MINSIDDPHDILFGVRRSVRYHTRRRMFFDRLDVVVQALAVIFGSVTIYTLFEGYHRRVSAIVAAVVTVLSATNLVVGSNRMARLHHDLARRFIALEKEILNTPEPTPEDLARWCAARLDIETEEPPPLRVLDSVCHNELMRAMGYPPEQLLRIGWLQRLFSPFFDFREHTIHSP